MNKNLNDFLNFDFPSFSKFLSNISPMEFGTIGCLVGLLISYPLNSNEQNSIGNFFELVGQVILTIQAQQSINSNPNLSADFNDFKKQTEEKINLLIKELKKRNNL